MQWISSAAFLVLVVYIAYSAAKWPPAIDRYIRRLAVDYKRWADLDDEYQCASRRVREEETFEQPVSDLKRGRRARAMEMGRQRDANAFRLVDFDETERIEARFRAELDSLDAEIKQARDDPTASR
jgi:hypothetical protein